MPKEVIGATRVFPSSDQVKIVMPRGARPGERRGGRLSGTPNKRTIALEKAMKAVLATLPSAEADAHILMQGSVQGALSLVKSSKSSKCPRKLLEQRGYSLQTIR